MQAIKRFDLPNDGLNMATDGTALYIRCGRTILQYALPDMRQTAARAVLQKDGKARSLFACGGRVYLCDFCDLHILQAGSLDPIAALRLGTDASSDLAGAVRCTPQTAYAGIRHGTLAAIDLASGEATLHPVCGASFWDHCIVDGTLYLGTVQGELLALDLRDMQVRRSCALGKKNLYSVVPGGGLLYTVSQDMTIRAVDRESFAQVCIAKKAVRGMARILGLQGDALIVADSGKISRWDRRTLQPIDTFLFPTGAFNKGVLLAGDRLIGSDMQAVYEASLA